MPHASERILLVEDERIVAMGESAVLTANGYDVTIEHAGEPAVDHAARENFDLILMDIDLGPGRMDGTEAAGLILQDHDIPVVFLSSHTEPEIVAKTEEITSYGYILKNSGDTVLLAGIRMAFRLHAAHLELEQKERLLSDTGTVARVGGWELDAQTREVRWTEETFRIHELPPGETPPLEKAIEFFHPEDRELLSHSVEAALSRGTPYDLEIRFITATGRQLWARTKCTPEVRGGTVVRLVGTFQDITEQKLIRDQREKILESVQSAVSIYNHATGRHEFINREVTRLTGRTLEEVNRVGDDFISLFHPDDREKMVAHLQRLRTAADDTPQRIEYRFKRKDGEWIWCLTSDTPFERDEEGTVIRSLGSFVDITDRKENERRLIESELRYQALVESIEDAVYILDRQWTHRLVNGAGCRYTGYAREDLLGTSLLELFPGIEETEIFTTFNSVMQERSPEIVESLYTFPDGREGWYEIRVFPVPEGILCISRDVTERKRIEADLRVSEQWWRSLVENSPDFIAIHDQQGRFVYMNRYAEGFTPADVIGTSAYAYMPDESQHTFRERSLRAFETGSLQRFDHAAMGDQGELRWYENFLIPLTDTQDEPQLLVISRDITERQHVEHVLQQHTERIPDEHAESL